MKKLIVATVAAMFIGAPLALAASTTTTATMPTTPQKVEKTHVAASSPSDRCTALGTQFDKAEATHKSNKNFKEALALRNEGKTLCTAHKDTDGIKKIESALTMIGVKPMVKS